MHILASGGSPPLPGFLNSLAGPLNHFGYGAILLLVILEDFGIPVPGETVLIAASVYAGAGTLNVVAVGVAGFTAAVIGDNIGFAIGRFGGRALVLRWGRYVRLTESRLAHAEVFFDRHGGWIITVARFIEVLRQANGIIAGITAMRWRRFLAFNALGAGLWTGTWVSLGYLAGSHIGTIYHYISQYTFYVLIALAVLLVGYIAWNVLRHRRRAAEGSLASGCWPRPGSRPARPCAPLRRPAFRCPARGGVTGPRGVGPARPADRRAGCRDGRARSGDLPHDVMPGCYLVAGRGDAGRVVQPLEVADLPVLGERDDQARGPGSGRAARAVQIVLGVVRRIVLHDEVDVIDVDAAGGDVGGDQDARMSGGEPVQGPLALVLVAVTVDGGGVDPGPAQLLG